MEEQTKRKKDAAAEKARTALKACMEDSQKKRSVCLAIEASPPPEPAPLAERADRSSIDWEAGERGCVLAGGATQPMAFDGHATRATRRMGS